MGFLARACVRVYTCGRCPVPGVARNDLTWGMPLLFLFLLFGLLRTWLRLRGVVDQLQQIARGCL